MNRIKPKRLQPGDTVGVIAPASPPNQENLERGLEFLRDLGLNIKMGKNVSRINGYLAGTDYERLTDLHEMFLDPCVKAVICACGGYGTGRIAAQINYKLIENNPKIFWGYSDITFLHTAIRQRTGLVTFHGPMLGSDIGKADVHELSKEGFMQLFEPRPIFYTEKLSRLDPLVNGVADGEITGGNLSLLISTLGTNFEIDTKDKLLFIEDVNEEPRAVDRMLNQLLIAGKLEEASGIIVGDFCDCTAKTSLSLTLDEVITHYVRLANKPSLRGFSIGHCNPNISIPIGTHGVLNTFEKELLIDSGVV